MVRETFVAGATFTFAPERTIRIGVLLPWGEIYIPPAWPNGNSSNQLNPDLPNLGSDARSGIPFGPETDAVLSIWNVSARSSHPPSLDIPLSTLPRSRHVWREFVYAIGEQGSAVQVAVVSAPGDLGVEAVTSFSIDPVRSDRQNAAVCYEIQTFASLGPSCGACREEAWRISHRHSVKLLRGHVLSLLWPVENTECGIAKILCPQNSRVVRLFNLAQTWLIASTRFKFFKALVRAEQLLLQIESIAQVNIRNAHLSLGGLGNSIHSLTEYITGIYDIASEFLLAEEYSPAEFARVLELLGQFAKESAIRLWKDVSGKALPQSTVSSIEDHSRECKQRWVGRHWQRERDRLGAQALRPDCNSLQASNPRLTSPVESAQRIPNRTISRILSKLVATGGVQENIGDPVKRVAIVKNYKRPRRDASIKQICADARVDQAEFYRWQRGEHVSINVLEKLAVLFQVSLEEVIAREDCGPVDFLESGSKR